MMYIITAFFFSKVYIFQCLNTYLIDTLQCLNTYDIDDKLYKCMNKITKMFTFYDIFNNLSKFLKLNSLHFQIFFPFLFMDIQFVPF